jgi:hypothetical protein
MRTYDSNMATAHLQSSDKTLGRLITRVGAFEINEGTRKASCRMHGA